MKNSTKHNLCGMTIISVALLLAFGPTFYGLYLAFSASVILGVIVMIVQPSPWIIGAVGLFNPHVADFIATWLGLK